jgi:RNA polymerase sigma-70 factor (ECF subfamily)
MGGIAIDMPGRRSAAASPTTATPPVPWFDDALPRIFGYFLPRVGGSVPLAEDLTQETMLAAVRALPAQGPNGELMPWLFGIARNKLVDHYRRHGRDRERAGPSDLDVEAIAEGDTRLPVLDLHAIHTRDAIVQTLATLPARQRLAIVLRYLDDLSVEDVADALDLSLQATESLLARARRAFRAHYLASSGDTA